MYMYRPADQQMYERQQYLLEQLSQGYQIITKEYPQPSKFLDRNTAISQTYEIESKLFLVKDLTRELTQMTTSRLLNFFNLIPEFQLLTQEEKQSLLIQNMLAVFMFHGALTYNPDTDTFVDQTTSKHPTNLISTNIILFQMINHMMPNIFCLSMARKCTILSLLLLAN